MQSMPRHQLGAVLVVVVCVLMGRTGIAAESAPAPSSRIALAVLPFVGSAAELPEEFGVALGEAVRHGLGQVRAVRLVESGTIEGAAQRVGLSLMEKPSDELMLRLAGELQARGLVSGSYRVDGDRLKVQARIADTRSGQVILGEEVAGPVEEFLEWQASVARQVLRQFRAVPTSNDEGRLKAAFAKHTRSVDAYVLYARARWQQGLGPKEGHEHAVPLFEKAIQLDENFAMAHFGLGVSLVATNNRWKASREIRKAIQLDENFAEAHRWLGDLLVNSPRRLYDQAIQSYLKAAEISPDSPEVFVGLGDARQAKGQYDEAIADYQQALRLQPDNARVYFGMGKIYYNEKQEYHEAVAAYEKAIQLDPGFLDAHLSLGEIYEEKGLYQEAIGRYSHVLSVDPRHPGATYGLALAYEKVDTKKAIEQWERYIDLASTLPSEKEWVDIARKHLNKLKREEKPN